MTGPGGPGWIAVPRYEAGATCTGPGVAQVSCVECEFKRPGSEASREAAYAITSVPPEVAASATLLGWRRGHWGIPYRSHHVRTS